jgi:hypothetical protein
MGREDDQQLSIHELLGTSLLIDKNLIFSMYDMCTESLPSFIDERRVLVKFDATKAMGVDDWVA